MAGPFIKRIRVRNFKSFADADLELGRFNVVVGANAAGKSNLVQIFRFLRDIRRDGLDNAVSMQGGPQYIHNLRLGGNSTSIELETALSEGFRIPVPTKHKVYGTGGKWRLEFKTEGQEIEIVEDSCTFRVSDCAERDLGDFMGGADGRQADVQKSGRREGSVKVTRNGGLCFDVDFDADLREALDSYTTKSHARKNELLVESGLLGHLFPRIFYFEDIGTYDFDSKRAGGSVPVKATPELEDDGSNLAAALKDILSNDAGRKTLHAVASDLLPFVKSVGVKDLAESAMFTLAEERLEKTPLPSPPLSDGTVNAVALIVALYFEETPVVVIEEPEKSMHPSLMARTVDMMKDASRNSQIIATTHSPELVRYAGLGSLYSIKRGEDGSSEVVRPSTNKEIKKFLENDMGIEEMHVQNMFDW